MKRDLHNNKEKYRKWKEKVKEGIPFVSEANSELILKFLNDMEIGLLIHKGSNIRIYKKLFI